ncbi:hypothetical protein V3C99_017756 [Haemonchus contortus]|uniref:Pre-mRNA-splicing factor SLU7 n=1 Tax=Haemonchus contortus TaxID=6289 RepID=A0A7I4Z457_HAECO
MKAAASWYGGRVVVDEKKDRNKEELASQVLLQELDREEFRKAKRNKGLDNYALQNEQNLGDNKKAMSDVNSERCDCRKGESAKNKTFSKSNRGESTY